jgi:hypothetical protein
MPTVYTCDIAKGISFKQFLFGCSRAFGAMIHLRDEKFDYEIPKEVPPSTYHSDRLAEAVAANLLLVQMTDEDRAKHASIANAESMIRFNKRRLEEIELKEKHEAMRTSAEQWVPPSEEHNALKAFMISQINESIKFDCGSEYLEPPVILNTLEWFTAERDKNNWEIQYHTEHYKAEIKKNKEINLWIKQLHESVKAL